jgi:hypothetical protein
MSFRRPSRSSESFSWVPEKISEGLERRNLPSREFALFLMLLFFEHGVMKIARDSFGDHFVGEFGRVVVLVTLPISLPRTGSISWVFRNFDERLWG